MTDSVASNVLLCAYPTYCPSLGQLPPAQMTPPNPGRLPFNLLKGGGVNWLHLAIQV